MNPLNPVELVRGLTFHAGRQVEAAIDHLTDALALITQAQEKATATDSEYCVNARYHVERTMRDLSSVAADIRSSLRIYLREQQQ